MSRLNEISDNPGATKGRMRVGRGVKGQKSRGGVSINGFEGGQMPIHMRAPKRGFNKLNRARYAEVNLGRLQKAIDAGKLDAKKDVDEAALVAAGLVRRVRDGVRLLAQGDLKTKVKVVVTGATASAIAAVEKAGGSVTVTKPVVADATA